MLIESFFFAPIDEFARELRYIKLFKSLKPTEGVFPMPHHGLLASQVSRLEALKSRHAILSHRVEKEQQSAASSDIDVKELKRQKLLLKDEIIELESATRA